jgi:hypothetical protein
LLQETKLQVFIPDTAKEKTKKELSLLETEQKNTQ